MTSPDVLSAVLGANIAAAIGILFVIALRKPARRIFGARLAYALWLLPAAAALAVLLPARSIVLDVAAPSLAPSIVEAPLVMQLPVVAAPGLSLDPLFLLTLLWVLGAITVAAWLWGKQARFLNEARLGRAGPAVVGLLRPRIILPANFDVQFSAEEREIILAHEQTHIRRYDTLANGLMCGLRCLFWFNPFIHAAAHLISIDQELACDAEVLAARPRNRRLYATAMLKAETTGCALPLGCYWPAKGRNPLLERIAMLKLKSPSPMARYGGAAAIALLCAGAGAGAWAARPVETVVVTTAAEALQSVPTTPAPPPIPAARTPAPAASAPEPAPIVLPPTVNLSNAGGEKPVWFVRDEAKVAAAKLAQDPGALIRAGGSPLEVGDLLRSVCGQTSRPRCENIPVAGQEAWGSYANGMVGLLGPTQAILDSGRMGLVLMGTPEMRDIPAPPEVIARQQAANDLRAALTPPELRGATMVGEPYTTDWGTQATRITGYRLSSGEFLPMEEYQRRMRAAAPG